MIDINKNNRMFAEMILELLEDNYDIPFTLEIAKGNDKWSNIMINFDINGNRTFVTTSINYKTQVIDGIFKTLSEKIDQKIINSYMK